MEVKGGFGRPVMAWRTIATVPEVHPTRTTKTTTKTKTRMLGMITPWEVKSRERYDAKKDGWTLLAPMLVPRSFHAAAFLGVYLYPVGGREVGVAVSSVERYHAKAVASLSTQRSALGIWVLGGYLYAVGGECLAVALSAVERYDPVENKWTSSPHVENAHWSDGNSFGWCCVCDSRCSWSCCIFSLMGPPGWEHMGNGGPYDYGTVFP